MQHNVWVSPQTALSCGSGTCEKGGNAQTVYKSMATKGFPAEWCDSYDFAKPAAGKCAVSDAVAWVIAA